MQRAVALVFLIVLFVGCAPDPVIESEKVITEEFIFGHTRYLSHNLLEGRGPGTRGDALARNYIAAQFEALGIEPGAPDGSYFQPVPLVGMTVDRNTNLIVTHRGQRRTYRFHNDFMPYSGVQEPVVRVAGELVFVGHGVIAPEFDWDDYKGKDMSGKILLVLNDDPGTEGTPELFQGATRTYYGRWTYKYEIAAELGAAGAIIIYTAPSAGYPWSVVQTSWGGENFDLAVEDDQPQIPLKAWTSERASRELLQIAGYTLEDLEERARQKDFKPIPLNIRVETTIRQRIRYIQTYNVLGLLRGGDPTKSDQAVVYTAHYDHLGVGPDGEIYNGALDNALGVSQMLSVARAFTNLPVPPHRSVLFAAVGAEEYGLLGSAYFAQNPTIPHRDIIANLNLDGGNIWGRTRDIIWLGSDRSTIGEVIENIAKRRGMVVAGDPRPEQGYFYRSDQFSFAKAGIPAVSISVGTDFINRPENWGLEQKEYYNEHYYHQPGDMIRDWWDLSGAVDQARFSFELGWELSIQREIPQWYPGDEFEAIRLASFEE